MNVPKKSRKNASPQPKDWIDAVKKGKGKCLSAEDYEFVMEVIRKAIESIKSPEGAYNLGALMDKIGECEEKAISRFFDALAIEYPQEHCGNEALELFIDEFIKDKKNYLN